MVTFDGSGTGWREHTLAVPTARRTTHARRVGSMTSRTAFVLVLAVALGGVPVRLSAQESQTHPLFELGLSGAFIAGMFDVSDFNGDIQVGAVGLFPNVGFQRFGAIRDRRGRDRRPRGDRARGHLRGQSGDQQNQAASIAVEPLSSTWWRGHYEFEHVTESQRQNQDGSITAYPAYDHKKLTGPNFFLITTGIRYLAGRHLAIRAEGGGVVGSPGFGIQGLRASLFQSDHSCCRNRCRRCDCIHERPWFSLPSRPARRRGRIRITWWRPPRLRTRQFESQALGLPGRVERMGQQFFFTTGPFRLLSEEVDFARVNLDTEVSSRLNSPNLQPVFTGLRGGARPRAVRAGWRQSLSCSKRRDGTCRLDRAI